MIKNFKPRLYQETIFATASLSNTLVVLPTGMGKTNIFLMLAAHRLKQFPKSKILLLGPTRPLIDQYYSVFEKYFEIDPGKMVIFTGMVKPEKRIELWKTAQIIFSTPQGLENDIMGNKIDLKDVSLLGFDEAHRAVGDYSYVFIAKRYHELARFPRIVAMTASPGSELEKINEVIQNLFIEDIEIRTDKSPDVASYVQKVKINFISVDFPEEFKETHKYLTDCFNSKLEKIEKYGYISSSKQFKTNKTDLLGLQATLQGEIAQGNRGFDILKSVSLAAEALKVQHAIELLETQGIEQLYNYLLQTENRAHTSTVKAVQNLVRDINFRSALIKTRSLFEKKIEHPKLAKLKELISEKIKTKNYTFIVFSQYRDSASKIVDELNMIDGAKAVLFVGQAKKNGTGLSQKKQIEILDKFRAGEYNILVSSSVGEEGLDIPSVNSVIFYEPIPSAIRQIQRRGRTARMSEGVVNILVTKNTRDEIYKWTAYHKEKRMYSTLEKLKDSIQFSKLREQNKNANGNIKKTIEADDKVKILIDYREKSSNIVKELMDLGANISLEKLESADYVCSPNCGIEYKTTEDFVDSLIDGRLLKQLKELKTHFFRSVIIVEGSQDIYSIRNVHPNAIRGMLATITVSYGIPILYSKNNRETASLIHIIAKREQDSTNREFSLHQTKRVSTIKDQQEYLVSALPGVGAGLSKPLLQKFGSVKNIINASVDELKEVEKIGEKKAQAIKDVVDSKYEE